MTCLDVTVKLRGDYCKTTLPTYDNSMPGHLIEQLFKRLHIADTMIGTVGTLRRTCATYALRVHSTLNEHLG